MTSLSFVNGIEETQRALIKSMWTLQKHFGRNDGDLLYLCQQLVGEEGSNNTQEALVNALRNLSRDKDGSINTDKPLTHDTGRYTSEDGEIDIYWGTRNSYLYWSEWNETDSI